MPTRKRIGRNVGRIELLAVQEEVKSLLAAGYDRKKIHDRLLADKSVTMSYPTFCYQLNKHLNNIAPVGLPNKAQLVAPTGQVKADPSEPFSLNRNPKAENLIGVKK